MAYPVMPLGFLGSQGGDSDTYRIERSLRFNSADSAYLSRTPANAGNRKTWTWSGWVKRSKIGVQDFIIFNEGGLSSNYVVARFASGGSGDNIEFFGSAGDFNKTTSNLFRDPSAWYHFVFVMDATNLQARIYVNGVEATYSTNTNPSNADQNFNRAQEVNIGRATSNTQHFDGYLTEINFIDGQALTPSSFGETDAITGRWKAKAYSGTYGTNGFYLSFKDNTSTTTLGYDDAGSNDWTLNNFSVSSGAGNDSLVDSPTNYGTDTGLGGEVRGNYATLNPLAFRYAAGAPTFSNGNLQITTNSSIGSQYAFSSIGLPISGKLYYEVTISQIGTSTSVVGVADIQLFQNSNFSNAIGYLNGGQKNVNGTETSYGASWTTGDIIGVAVDTDSQTITFYKNNTSQGSLSFNCSGLFPNSQLGVSSASHIFNFGQRPFAYAAPAGFKCLCTQNLPQPTIQKPSTAMDAVTYTGTGASQSISSLGFSPDLVWIKGRSGATDHAIYDTTRGVQQDLGSNLTTDETTEAQGLTAFGANGFTIGTLAKINTSTATYVGWAWDESAINGLDIVSYTGNGTARTISHNLGVAPKMIIVKARTTASTDQGWPVYHASNTAAPETDYLLLSSDAATADLDTVWNDTAPTASVFSVGTGALVNTNNDTYIAYLFSEVEGFSKFGSYTGNGSSDGPFVWCGFRPALVISKNTGGTGNWTILDNQREGYNVDNDPLFPNLSNAEGTTDLFDFLSNGFKTRSTDSSVNTSGTNYIFAAFAEAPFKYARAR